MIETYPATWVIVMQFCFFQGGNQRRVAHFLWLMGLIYSAIVCLPVLFGPQTGLDASWTYAISHAATVRWVFGREIIFTYGPLGYLVSGAALEQNFLAIYAFKLVIQGVFVGVIFRTITQCKTRLQRIALFLAAVLFLRYFISTEYEIILLALLSSTHRSFWQSRHLPKWAFGLGILAGLALLTKFTVGVSVAAIFLICIHLGQMVRFRSTIADKLIATVNCLLAIVSTLAIGLDPHPIQSALKILVCGCIAGGVARMFAQGWQRWLEFYIMYLLGFVVYEAYFTPDSSVLDYLKACSEISSGYVSAMVTVGSEFELGTAIFMMVVFLILLISTFQVEKSAPSLSLALILFLVFKHGFVRADSGHVIIFFALAPVITAIALSQMDDRGAQMKWGVGYLCTLGFLIMCLSHHYRDIAPHQLRQLFTPSVAWYRLQEWGNPRQYYAKIRQESQLNLSNLQFPADIRERIGDRAIDIIPWEISLAAANRLNWKPRPIFQSYSAYTAFLDEMNFESLSKRDRDYIIYSFHSIDGRHPFFDEPKMLFNLFCHYRLALPFPKFTPHSETQFFLLEKRSGTICPSATSTVSKTISWQATEMLNPDPNTLIRAGFRFQYSWLGRIYKTLLRSPPIKMRVNYVDGSVKTYRVVPDNAVNGVLISHLAKDDRAATSLFEQQLPLRVQSVSLDTDNSLMYQKTIELQLSTYRMSNHSR